MEPVKSTMETKESAVSSPTQAEHDTAVDGKRPPPLLAKIFAVFLISCISFGSHWSSGVTGAMKSTIKKQMHVSNTQFSLLEASEDFMATVLLLISGVITDRIGGAEMIIYGNAIYTIGSILVAAATTVRSFNFMIGGRVILALGDIATQIAQYKMFSSWFPPSNGFASTLGFELAVGKIGGFVGKSTANVIAKKTGNFAWVFWTSVFMNLFTNAATVIFWFFNRYCNVHYRGRQDTATKEVLTEKNKKFELQKMFQLPWMFWTVMAFSLFQTSTASVFSQNATELAEKRFNVDSITAGWYSSLSQYAVCVCGIGMFLSMVLVNFAETRSGTAASFGIYAIAVSFGPTSIIDSIRTTLWHQSVFGSAYALKVTMNNAMNIIIRIITGALQDADDDSYRRVVRVYLFLAAASVVVGLAILLAAVMTDSLAPLQWTRKQRLTLGPEHINMIRERHTVTCYARSKLISIYCFSALLLLTVGGWVAYIWGAVTGNNS
ncbi:putative MFS transporter [Aspergillus fischeri NRRL 181]|uniref:Lysosomal dipeptide transporter MFSD1 n=1 Tax=Neosartorya fischeri (strain ATCC 1020 / DSM 3700 / CBS 544.65 / FGSC A1164 / JCM 1740 / NRRL 181 / WB 181) TaxID=331117 RepID=A1CVE0_NEOFI|nr:MFS transporter, putative [Aspergillus fischeri NRRL 181]EAW25717.1 MFS transporter, putative [Aspergillus fischeri NRRL 181]